MQVYVESDSNHHCGPIPRRVWFDGRCFNVSETLDQWYGANYRYIKIRGDDGGLYILRFDEIDKVWELTMFTGVRSRDL